VKNYWLIDRLRFCGRPVLFLVAICLGLGSLFIEFAAFPVGIALITAGTGALLVFVWMSYRAHRQQQDCRG